MGPRIARSPSPVDLTTLHSHHNRFAALTPQPVRRAHTTTGSLRSQCDEGPYGGSAPRWLTVGVSARIPDDELSRLLSAAASGDVAARDRFVAAVTDEVERLCRFLGDADSVDDLVQETFERMMRALPRYRGDGPALHWVRQIARRTCADATRRRIRQRRRDSRSAPTPQDESVLDGATTEIDDLVARLDRDRRDAFLATQVLGLSYAEAA